MKRGTFVPYNYTSQNSQLEAGTISILETWTGKRGILAMFAIVALQSDLRTMFANIAGSHFTVSRSYAEQ